MISAKDISIEGSSVKLEKVGNIAMWWRIDKRVTVDYSIGESFDANTEEEVKTELVKQINANIAKNGWVFKWDNNIYKQKT